MAPSYKEDDDQERQFDFDWEREGLPDYLKPFLADESGAGSPAAPPGGAAGPTAPAAAQSGAMPPGDDLPDWLGGTGLPTASAGYGTPPTPPATAGAGNLDMEGLPDWLRGDTAPSHAPAAPPPSLSNLDTEGLPSWLQSSGSAAPPPAPAPAEADTGLPPWLQSASPTPSAPTPQADWGNVQPFDLGATAGAPHEAGLDNVQPFDFGQMGGGLSNVQPYDFGQSTVQPFDFGQMGGASDVQPFDFGQMGGQGQPFDQGASAPPTSPAAGMAQEELPSWLQSAAPAAPTPPAPQPAPAMNMDQEGLPSWLQSAPPAPAPAAAPPAPAANLDQEGLPSWLQNASPAALPTPGADLGDVQPFDFGQLGGDLGHIQPFDFGAAASPAPSAPADLGGVQPFDFGQMSGGDLGNVQTFDFGATASPAPADVPAAVQPFDFSQFGGDLGDIQPFDLGAATGSSPAPATPSSMGQSFDLGTPAPASSSPPVESLDDFVDFLSADEAPAAPAGMAPPAGVQPFSLEGLNMGAPAAGADVIAPFNPAEFNFQPFAFDHEPMGATGQPTDLGALGGLPGGDLAGIQPFSFEDLNLPAPAPASPGSFGRRAEDQGYDQSEEAPARPFAWQQPPTPAFRRQIAEEEPVDAGESIFAKARRRKEELEAALRQETEEVAAPAVPATPAAEEPLETTDLWPTYDDETVAEPPQVPATPARAEEAPVAAAEMPSPAPATPPTAEAAALDMGATPAPPDDVFDFTPAERTGGTAPLVEESFDMSSLQPFDVSAIEAEAPPEAAPFDFASLDTQPTAEVPTAPATDVAAAQPEQLWSVPTAPAEPASAAPESTAEGEFDFSGLPQFDLASLGLTPEEEAYLLQEQTTSAVGEMESPASVPEAPPAPAWEAPAPADMAAAAVPATLDAEPLPSWLSGEAVAPTELAPAAPVEVPAEPALAETFSGEDTTAWPAPAEPLHAETTEGAPGDTAPSMGAAPEPAAPAPVWEPGREAESVPEIIYRPAPAFAPPVTAAARSAEPLSMGQGESVDDLLRQLDADPDDAAARLVLAGVYEEREDYGRAMEQYRLLIKTRAVPTNVLEIVIGNLRDLVEAQPDDAAAHRLLGDAYRKAGMYQAAISQYNWLLRGGSH